MPVATAVASSSVLFFVFLSVSAGACVCCGSATAGSTAYASALAYRLAAMLAASMVLEYFIGSPLNGVCIVRKTWRSPCLQHFSTYILLYLYDVQSRTDTGFRVFHFLRACFSFFFPRIRGRETSAPRRSRQAGHGRSDAPERARVRCAACPCRPGARQSRLRAAVAQFAAVRHRPDTLRRRRPAA